MFTSSRFISILISISIGTIFCSAQAALGAAAAEVRNEEDHRASGRRVGSTSNDDDLTDLQRQTLESIRQIDDYPMYVMTYYGDYGFGDYINSGTDSYSQNNYEGGCTSFTALNRNGDIIFGYNHDGFWSQVQRSVIVFTDPPNGYASVAIIRGDFSHFGNYIDNPGEGTRRFVWRAPFYPIDGMNEYGVVISPMSLPSGDGISDPSKRTLHLLHLIRLVLDYARNVREAISLLKQYNNSDTSVHYLISDAYGNSAVVEYLRGNVVATRNVEPWQVSTNFFIDKAAPDSILFLCPRYEEAYRVLESYNGLITEEIAFDILESVSAKGTGYDGSGESVWSSVYNSTTGDVNYCIDRGYDNIQRFRLPMIVDLADIKTTANPTRLDANGKMRLVARITNLSPSLSSATTVDFYLSRKRRLNKRSILIGSRRVPSIAYEGTRNIRLRINLPDEIKSGKYYLISCVNEDGANNDDDEENNTSICDSRIIVR